ncbi:MAG: hypothetical protein MUC87_09620 [Bacteroidia bacterium]|jgi:hypothetical protein|nr:hypothetical protein [Bacteroidia bacterium]
MKRCFLLLALCAAVLRISAQSFTWKTDLPDVKSGYEKLFIGFSDSSRIDIFFPDSKQDTCSKQFLLFSSEAAQKWIETILTDSAGAENADSLTASAYSAYYAWLTQKQIEQRTYECKEGKLFCRQYGYTSGQTFSLVTLAFAPGKLHIWFEKEGVTTTYALYNTQAATISTLLRDNNKTLKDVPAAEVNFDSIAALFFGELTAHLKNQQLIQEKQNQLDEARSVVEDMAVQRGVALTVFLGKPGNQTIPKKVQIYEAAYKKVNKKSARKRPYKYEPGNGKDTLEINKSTTVTIDSVYLSFANYVLTTVRVYAHEESGSRKPHVFINPQPLSVSSPRALEYTCNAMLREEISLKRNDKVKYLYLSDILTLDPAKEKIITDYIPQDTNLVLHACRLNAAIRKSTVASSFRVNAFTDLTGFLDSDAPNGKLQTEIHCIIPMRTRVSSVLKPAYSRSSITFLKTLVPELCVAKLGDDNRLLTVNVDTAFKVPTSDSTSVLTTVAHVNHFKVFQHANFWGGGRVNLFTIEDRNQNSLFYINFRFRYIRTQFADTLLSRDRVFNSLSVFYETEFYYKRRIMKNFTLDLAFSAGLFKLYDNSLSLSYGTMYGNNRDNSFTGNHMPENIFKAFWNKEFRQSLSPRMIYTPMMILRYTKYGSRANGMFIRIAFPNSFSNNNAFLIAHIGYIRPLESLFNKTQGAAAK